MTAPKTITVIKADGSTGEASERDQQLLAGMQKVLAADAHFQALKTPVLDRAEVNAGLAETEDGYLYLCYQVAAGTPQEFWGHWGTHNRVAFRSGKITVDPTP